MDLEIQGSFFGLYTFLSLRGNAYKGQAKNRAIVRKDRVSQTSLEGRKIIMKRKILIAVPLFALTALVLLGCATRVRFDAPRAPNMNVAGIQRVAVAPFEAIPAGAGPIAASLTSEVTTRLGRPFQLVSYSQAMAARTAGRSLEDYVDAIFRGRVTNFVVNTTVEQGTRIISIRPFQTEPYTYHRREVEVAFEYYFVRASDGSMVGPVRRVAREVHTSESAGGLIAGPQLASNAVARQLAMFYRDVEPHRIGIVRTLERAPSGDLRPLFRAAEQQRREGNIIAARNSFIAIWENHGSIPAAVNAAILYEATGDLEDGVFLMEQVVDATGAPRAVQKLTQLNREVAEVLGLEAFDAHQAPAERVASHALFELRNLVASGARLWIHNNATADQTLVNGIINDMESELLREGFVIVERGMIELIAAEQNLHLEGGVADSDFVSIGNLAGANTVVIIGMTGSGGARRLNVRVLDIETGTLRMQSGTGVAWRL